MRIVQSLCCWDTDYCKCQFLHLSRNQNIKLSYILFILITLTLTLLLSKLKKVSPTLTQTFNCTNNSSFAQKQEQCVVEQITYRWFLALAFMHFLLIFFVFLRNQISKIMNQGAWLIKVCVIVGVGFLFMYGMSDRVMYAIQIGSAFLVPVWYFFQSLIIIDMIYTVDNSLKELSDSNNKFHVVKALLGLIAMIGAVVLNVLSYVHHKDVSQTFFVSVISSIQMGVFLIICLLRVSKSNTLFVYGFVMLYSNLISYYIHCPATQYTQSAFNSIQIALSIISLLFILSPGSNKIRTKKSSLNQILALNTSKQQQDNRYVSSNKWIVFHFIFFLICLTLPWVLNQAGQSFVYGEGLTNVWAENFKIYRILGWFLITFIYVWVLVASRLFPEQDFDQLQNYFKEFQLN